MAAASVIDQLGVHRRLKINARKPASEGSGKPPKKSATWTPRLGKYAPTLSLATDLLRYPIQYFNKNLFAGDS